MSQPLESSQLDAIQIKKGIADCRLYTIKIAIVFFLGNRNHIIIFLSWQLLVFISLSMQNYSKRLLTDTTNIYFKFLFQLFTNLVSRTKIRLQIHHQPLCLFDIACLT